jgi:deazaflavin-dependent oxidoreductase (nitroreductase family)
MAAAFRGPEAAHWRRLALTHGALGAAALATDWSLRPRRPTRADVLAGLGAGLGLFAASTLADARARRSVPGLDSDASALGALSRATGPARMCGYLALMVAPGEELLWRGLVQGQLARRFGPGRAAIITSVVYGAAHVPTGNRAVTGAAAGAGAVLSAMRAGGAGTGVLALAHASWVVPTLLRERARASRDAATDGGKSVSGQEAPAGQAPAGEAGPAGNAGRAVTPWGKLAQLANNGLHIALYEKSRGRLGTRMLGNEVGILTTTRPRDGQPYAVPLFTFRDGRDVIVVASYRGSAAHPAWFRHLVANPEASIQVRGRSWAVRAGVMDADERAVWWDRVVRGFRGYAGYQDRTTREIPLIRLVPRGEGT